jgi:hypothetical protein
MNTKLFLCYMLQRLFHSDNFEAQNSRGMIIRHLIILTMQTVILNKGSFK